MADLTALEALLAAATKGEWQLQDGCSWRRIGTHFHDGDVLCPIKQRDGHPDLCAADGKVYANLELIVAAVNALPSLIAEARQSAARVKELEEAVRTEREACALAVQARLADCDTADEETGIREAVATIRSRSAGET